MAKTLVEEANGWVTEHYFKIQEDKGSKTVRLLVDKNPKEPIDALKNPEVLVDVRNISEKTKTLVLRWRRNADYAYPVFSEQHFGDRLVTSSDLGDAYRLGIALRDLHEGEKPQEQKSNKLLIVLIIGALILGFVNIVIMVQVAEKVGVVLV